MLVAPAASTEIANVLQQSIPRMIPKVITLLELRKEINSMIVLDKMLKNNLLSTMWQLNVKLSSISSIAMLYPLSSNRIQGQLTWTYPSFSSSFHN